MFNRIREWIQNNRPIAVIIGMAFVGVVALVLASGFFEIQVSEFFAVGPCNNNNEGTMRCRINVVEECDGSEWIQVDDCSPDRCTYEGGGAGCGGGSPSTPEPCDPVAASTWKDGANACKPEPSPSPVAPPVPENWWAHRELQNRSGLPALATSTPYGANLSGYTCFGFTIPEGNPWSNIDTLTGGTLPATGGAGSYTLTGQFFNNCPWEVEMTGGAAGSPKGTGGYIFKPDGTIDEPIEGLDNLITRNFTTLIPSCWNYVHLPADGSQVGCTGTYSITLDLSGLNAGRVEAALGWVHHDEIGSAPGDVTRQDGYTIVVETKRDCAGAPGETCASQMGGGGGSSGISGPGPGGSFNCGTGESSDGCWCGEWTDAIWAQRHANAGHSCNPGYVLTAEYKAFLAEHVPSFSVGDGAPDGTSDDDILNWSRNEVQAFIDIMDDNFVGGNQGCTPKSSGIDYAGIQEKYFAIGAGGIGLSGNGSSAVGATCRLNIGIDPSVLTATCTNGRAPINLSWNIPIGAVANGLIKRTDGGDGQFLSDIGRLTTNYSDTDVEPGHSYQYQHKVHASVASEPVDVEIDADGTCRVLGGATETHTICQSNACVLVDGAGTDECSSDVDCGGGTTEPVCGDGTCNGSESCNSCADDCGSCNTGCGDNICGSNETCSSCTVDCGSCSATCGNDVCDSGESPQNCAHDCGSPGAACNDGVCDKSESCSSCSNDCGICGPGGGQTGGGGGIGGAGQTPTGPGEAVFLAFMLASVTVLLYVSYTHTTLFRRREIQKVSDDRDSMDFRQ